MFTTSLDLKKQNWLLSSSQYNLIFVYNYLHRKNTRRKCIKANTVLSLVIEILGGLFSSYVAMFSTFSTMKIYSPEEKNK